MFTMCKGWERFFYLCTYVAQGSSFLSPRGYAILHRMHHAFSDTPKDPHSPTNYTRTSSTMMLATKKKYDDFAYRPRRARGALRRRRCPSGPRSTGSASPGSARIAWGAAYALFYFKFATHAVDVRAPARCTSSWAPIHGAIVNWCGHKYGYQNFDNGDAVAKHAGVRLRHGGRALPEQPPQVRHEPELRGALVRARPDLPGDARPRLPSGIIDMNGAQAIRPPVKEVREAA